MKRLILIILLLISCNVNAQDNIKEFSFDLYSLNNASQTSGSFILGCGSINETEYYFGFIKTEKGITRLKCNVYNAYIVETNKIKPKITCYYTESFLSKNCKTLQDKLFYLETWRSKKIIYIPKGTIIQKYELK